MITPSQSRDNANWLRQYAAENHLGPMDLQSEIENVKYSTIVKWVELGSTMVPRNRAHTRAVAAMRKRLESRARRSK